MRKTIYTEPYRALLRWLKASRQARGLSLRALALNMGVSHTWIGKIEQAERRMDIAEFVRLCDALRINPHDGLNLLLSAPYDRPANAPQQSLSAVAERRAPFRVRP